MIHDLVNKYPSAATESQTMQLPDCLPPHIRANIGLYAAATPASSTPQQSHCHTGLKEKIRRAVSHAIHIHNGVSKGLRPLAPLFHPEVYDRKHRRGRLMAPFFTAWKESTTADNYDTWLNKLDMGEEVPGKDVLKRQNLIGPDGKPNTILSMQYLTPQQLKAREMKLDSEGRIVTDHNKGTFFVSKDKTKDNSIIFVIGPDDKVYLDYFSRGTFGHPSFLQGKAVKAAGVLIFDRQGRLEAIWDDSGHYNGHYITTQLDHKPFPTKQMMIDTVHILQSKGINMSNVEVIFTGKNSVKAKELIDKPTLNQ